MDLQIDDDDNHDNYKRKKEWKNPYEHTSDNILMLQKKASSIENFCVPGKFYLTQKQNAIMIIRVHNARWIKLRNLNLPVVLLFRRKSFAHVFGLNGQWT